MPLKDPNVLPHRAHPHRARPVAPPAAAAPGSAGAHPALAALDARPHSPATGAVGVAAGRRLERARFAAPPALAGPGRLLLPGLHGPASAHRHGGPRGLAAVPPPAA